MSEPASVLDRRALRSDRPLQRVEVGAQWANLGHPGQHPLPQPNRAAGPAPPEAAADGTLSVFGDLAAIEQEWRDFEQQADCTPFQTFGWMTKWQRHIGTPRSVRPAIVLGRDETGAILFVFPLAVEPAHSGRRLTWLGSDLCDYNGPLLAQKFSSRFNRDRFLQLWAEILRRLRSDQAHGFDFVDLQKMPESIGAQPNPFLALPTGRHPSGAYVADLGPDWDAYYQGKRSSTVRKQERKQLRRLSDHGVVSFLEVVAPDEMVRTLDTMFVQKGRSLARMGVENVFARPGHHHFFRDLCTDPDTRHLAQLTRLDVGSVTAAVNFGLRFRAAFYLVISSYGEGELARFGPGRAHLRETIKHAIETGCRQFDFTVGDEPYKRDWADTELTLHDHLQAATPRGWLYVAAARAFRRTKRFIKQNPSLWRAFSVLRTRAGCLAGR